MKKIKKKKYFLRIFPTYDLTTPSKILHLKQVLPLLIEDMSSLLNLIDPVRNGCALPPDNGVNTSAIPAGTEQ